jgi:hypothetical protein
MTPSVEIAVKNKVQGGGLGDQGRRCYPMTLCILVFIVGT